MTVYGDLRIDLVYASKPFNLTIATLQGLKTLVNVSTGSTLRIPGVMMDVGYLSQTFAEVDYAELPPTVSIPLSTFCRRNIYSWPLISAIVDVCIYPETVWISMNSTYPVYRVDATWKNVRLAFLCKGGECVVNVTAIKSPDIDLEYYYKCGLLTIVGEFSYAYVDLYENRLIVAASSLIITIAAILMLLSRVIHIKVGIKRR